MITSKPDRVDPEPTGECPVCRFPMSDPRFGTPHCFMEEDYPEQHAELARLREELAQALYRESLKDNHLTLKQKIAVAEFAAKHRVRPEARRALLDPKSARETAEVSSARVLPAPTGKDRPGAKQRSHKPGPERGAEIAAPTSSPASASNRADPAPRGECVWCPSDSICQTHNRAAAYCLDSPELVRLRVKLEEHHKQRPGSARCLPCIRADARLPGPFQEQARRALVEVQK